MFAMLTLAHPAGACQPARVEKSGGMSFDSADVTILLRRAASGDHNAREEFYRLVYPELRRLAAGYLARERPDHTLQPTALVNEAFLRFPSTGIDWHDRTHFFAVAATIMRRILVDHAR